MDKKITAMIPAKWESQRLERKNLALINGQPLIHYAIKAAQESGVFERIVVNSDHAIFGEIAGRYGIDFYKRPPQLARPMTKSDDVVKDFLDNHPCDILVWVNSTSPLQTAEDIRETVDHFLDNRLDSLITTKQEQVHCTYKKKPVNFSLEESFARTQDLEPVHIFVYSIMMWNRKTFLEAYQKRGYALLCGKIGYFPIGKQRSIIIKTQEDLELAEQLMKVRKNTIPYRVNYDPVVKKWQKNRGF